MTLAELAVTLTLLGGLGLLTSRFGLSAIPAYLLAGMLLGPQRPEAARADRALGGDRLRGRARDHARPPDSKWPACAARGRDRSHGEPGVRAARRSRRLRLPLRRTDPRRRDLRLLERD